LSEAIVWLDEWESNVSKGLIEEKYFLTRQTYEELRITIQSTIDIVKYLLYECDLKYVLTAKCNQDNLEVLYVILMYLISYNTSSTKYENYF